MSQKNVKIDGNFKKQITLYVLLSLSFQSHGKRKQALSCAFEAHNIVKGLYDEKSHQPKDLDHVLQVNLLLAFILLKLGKLREALDFIGTAEDMVSLLVKYNIQNKNPPQLQKHLDQVKKLQK